MKAARFIALSVAMAVSAVATFAARPGVGLVLSGGGAKGIAHIGFIQALEDNDIPIDCIAGTSMGSIVGSLYSIGYSPADMMSLLASEYFASMAAGEVDPGLSYYFARPKQTPQMFGMDFGNRTKDVGNRFDPQSLIAPSPMGFGFMQIYGPASAQAGNDFDRLMIPFRSVASNVTENRAEVFGKGNLGDCVRASMSFPMIFQPVKIDGDIMYDGGLYAVFPVEVMDTVFNPEMILGVDVSAGNPAGAPNSYMDQLDMLIQHPQSLDVPADRGIKVRIDLNEYGLLDWGAAATIYRRGYESAMAMMDSIKSRVPQRRKAADVAARRKTFLAGNPNLTFEKVNVTGGTEAQNEYIRQLFSPRNGADSLTEDEARADFYRVLSSGKIKTLASGAVYSDPERRRFTLNLDAIVKKNFDVGLGGYITSSNNSFLYARAGFSSLSFSSLNADVETWIGQSYMAAAISGQINIPTHTPSALRFMAVAARRKFYESEKVFFKDNEPSFVTKHEYFGRFSYAVAAGRTGEIDFGIGGGRQYNSFYCFGQHDAAGAGRDNVTLDLGQAFVTYSSSTLDNFNFPTSGHSYKARLMGFYGSSQYCGHESGGAPFTLSSHPAWAQIEVDIRKYFDIHKHFSFGIEGQTVASNRKLMPDYYSTISTAPGFEPTPSLHNVFDPELRAFSYAAAGIVPVYKYDSRLSARANAYLFMPYRRLLMNKDGGVRRGGWFDKAEFIGEVSAVLTLPFADLSVYGNWTSTRHHFNVGISLGIYITAPQFLR